MSQNIIDKLEMPATLEDVLKEVSRIKTTVTEAVDDGVKQAVRTLKQGRHAAEDAIDDARRSVKQNPLLREMRIVPAVRGVALPIRPFGKKERKGRAHGPVVAPLTAYLVPFLRPAKTHVLEVICNHLMIRGRRLFRG